MPVHTFTIAQQISPIDIYNLIESVTGYNSKRVNNIYSSLICSMFRNKEAAERSNVFAEEYRVLNRRDIKWQNATATPYLFTNCSPSPYIGINNMKLQRINIAKKYTKEHIIYCSEFYLLIEVNPYKMLQYNYDNHDIGYHNKIADINLYNCDRNKELSGKFNYILSKAFYSYNGSDKESLCNFESYTARRVDYTVDLKFNSRAQKEAFYEFSHRTSGYSRTNIKKIDDIALNEQSAAEGNKSYKTLFYDKEAQLRSVHASNKAIAASANIIRFEHQCCNNGLKSIYKKYCEDHESLLIPKRSIVYFLDEDIACAELLNRYKKMIGSGRIMKYDKLHHTLTAETKKLKRAVSALSFVNDIRAEGLPKLKENMASATYYRRMKIMHEFNINPVVLNESYNIDELPDIEAMIINNCKHDNINININIYINNTDTTDTTNNIKIIDDSVFDAIIAYVANNKHKQHVHIKARGKPQSYNVRGPDYELYSDNLICA